MRTYKHKLNGNTYKAFRVTYLGVIFENVETGEHKIMTSNQVEKLMVEV